MPGVYTDPEGRGFRAGLDAGNAGTFSVEGGLKAPELRLPALSLFELKNGELDVEEMAIDGGELTSWRVQASRLLLREPLRARYLHLSSSSVLTVPEPTLEKTWTIDLLLSGELLVDGLSRVESGGQSPPDENERG